MDIVTGGRSIVIMCLYVCCRSLAVGTKTGYKLFSLTMVEKLDCIHESGQYVALLLQVLRQCGLNICLHLVNNYISLKRLCDANSIMVHYTTWSIQSAAVAHNVFCPVWHYHDGR